MDADSNGCGNEYKTYNNASQKVESGKEDGGIVGLFLSIVVVEGMSSKLLRSSKQSITCNIAGVAIMRGILPADAEEEEDDEDDEDVVAA